MTTVWQGIWGFKKTLNRVLRHLHWPGIRSDVVEYCRSCHVCQVVGKPNQAIPLVPSHPIPAIDEPFGHVMVYCVVPLSKVQ